jgi:hypothetical protein
MMAPARLAAAAVLAAILGGSLWLTAGVGAHGAAHRTAVVYAATRSNLNPQEATLTAATAPSSSCFGAICGPGLTINFCPICVTTTVTDSTTATTSITDTDTETATTTGVTTLPVTTTTTDIESVTATTTQLQTTTQTATSVSTTVTVFTVPETETVTETVTINN